jgi:uncharacterized lipoprotein YmbA
MHAAGVLALAVLYAACSSSELAANVYALQAELPSLSLDKSFTSCDAAAPQIAAPVPASPSLPWISNMVQVRAAEEWLR